ncbi:unnamed protein product [Prunus armeniaca]
MEQRRVIEEHFKTLFTTEARRNNDDILNCVVTQATNDNLLQEINVEEIKEAIMQMGGLKAPGPMDIKVFSTTNIGI